MRRLRREVIDRAIDAHGGRIVNTGRRGQCADAPF
jgi:hypothetical protein